MYSSHTVFIFVFFQDRVDAGSPTAIVSKHSTFEFFGEYIYMYIYCLGMRNFTFSLLM